MTENRPDIQSFATKLKHIQDNHILLLGQVTEKNEKADPSLFLKFLLSNRLNGKLGFARYTSRPLAKPKEPLLTFGNS